MPPSEKDLTGRRKYAATLRDLGKLSIKAIDLVWAASPRLALAIGCLTILQGLNPAAIAWVGARIVDAVVLAATGGETSLGSVLGLVAVEGGLVAAVMILGNARSFCDGLLRLHLSHSVQLRLLHKALSLSVAQFEDAEFYDKLSRAQSEASHRPLAIIQRLADFVRNVISLVGAALLLVVFAPWAAPVLAVAAIPGFLVEASFARREYSLFRRHSANLRSRHYITTVLTREDYVKEERLLGLGRYFLNRFKALQDLVVGEIRPLAVGRVWWSSATGLLSTIALYLAYSWSVVAAALGRISLGDMTMSMQLYRQCQASISSSLTTLGLLYSDNLYLSNLFEFLEAPGKKASGDALAGPHPEDGIRFEAVGFRYPGSEAWALRDISFHLKPGESLGLVGENGSGKTTLIKLLAGLYRPTEGRILLDGLDLQDWEEKALGKRISVLFQDFVRYQLTLGENIGIGDVEFVDNEPRWIAAGDRGGLASTVAGLPQGYHTQLGHWFGNGVELSGGQWQTVAASRAWMRESADILILDEPTSALDASAEARLMERFKDLMSNRTTILISHRLPTLRLANRLLVLHRGKMVELGDHASLLRLEGQYARLFELQAAGYR